MKYRNFKDRFYIKQTPINNYTGGVDTEIYFNDNLICSDHTEARFHGGNPRRAGNWYPNMDEIPNIDNLYLWCLDNWRNIIKQKGGFNSITEFKQAVES